jgi:hypothetical protein
LSLVVQEKVHFGLRDAGFAMRGLLDAALDELASEAKLGQSLALPVKASDSVFDELTSDAVFVRGWTAEKNRVPILRSDGVTANVPWEFDVARHGTCLRSVSEVRTGKIPVPQSASPTARLAVVLVTAGFIGHRASGSTGRNRRFGSLNPGRRLRK